MPNPQWQSAPAEPPAPALADKATEALRLGDFKQAIELFKRLLRRDARQEWRDALVEAYVGRARLLAARGMFEEAESALNKAAAGVGTAGDPLLHVQCLVKRGKLQKATELAVNHVAADAVPASRAEPLAELAAALWLAAPAPPAAAGERKDAAAFYEHGAAARESLTAWIEGKPADEIDRSLSRIPLRSAFGTLRLLLKSLLTAADDPARARRLLDAIAPESPFASLRLALAASLPGASEAAAAPPASKAQQVFAIELKGLPSAASQSLVQLTKAERGGAAALLSFLAGQARTLPAEDVRRACLDLLPAAPHRLRQFESAFGPLPDFERNRLQALGCEAAGDFEEAARFWSLAAGSLAPTPGTPAGLTAGVVYRHLAHLARVHPQVADAGTSEFPEIDYIEQAVRADPDHLPAVLQLIGLYRRRGRDREWHTTADHAARRFPDESAVLLQAVDSAIARKAYKKAVGFARKLLAIDPINEVARRQMIELHVSHARKQVRASRLDLAAKELGNAAQWERPDAPNFLLRIHQGLLGLKAGHGRDAEALLRQGVELAGGGVAGWVRASLEHALMNATEAGAGLLREELTRAREAEAPTREAIAAVIAALNGADARDSKKASTRLVFRIRGWLLQGSGLAWPAAEFHAVAEAFARAGAYDLMGDYARAGLRRDPDDDVWRYYQVVARTKGDPDRLSFGETHDLFEIEHAAAGRSDYHMVNRIRRFMVEEDDAPPPRRPRFPTRRREGPDGAADGDTELDEAAGDLLKAVLTDTPGEVVRDLIEKLGQRGAVTALLERLLASPLGGLGEPLLRMLASQMIEAAVEAMRAGA